MLAPSDVFNRSLTAALHARGQYVYGYYEPEAFEPFYVGKGSGTRVLDHWRSAIKNPTKAHEQHIQAILRNGDVPHVSLLAYNLDSSDEDRHALAERVLQDAFGIQAVVQKRPGGDRLLDMSARLLQKREDSAKRRPLSLESVLASHAQGKPHEPEDLRALATQWQCPILLVGLMKTFHSAYQDAHLREMARMFWNLELYKGTTLSALLAKKAILLAWTSKLTGRPVIIGAWRIDGRKASFHSKFSRYEFPAKTEPELKKEFLGIRLAGSGLRWHGPKIYVPDA